MIQMLDTLTFTHSDILELNNQNLPRINVILTMVSKTQRVVDYSSPHPS